VIGEITAAATEQSSGIAGVNQAIGNLDQMTQQNAALVEESAAAAESLREQADRMKQAVAVFKVGAVSAHGVELAAVPVRSAVPKAPPFKGAERRGGSDAGPAARAAAPKPAAPKVAPAKKPAPSSPPHVVNTTAKVVPQTSTRVTPAGGDDDWETF
jgi:hypothetical protein